MKRILIVLAAVALIATVAGAQSLGDLARHQRAQKRPSAKKVYTNDDIPSAQIEEPAPAPAAAAAADKKAGEKGAPKADDKSAKVYEVRITELKKEVSQLEREINVNQREGKLRAAQYYSDAGNSLRDPKAWAEEQRKAQAELDTKQKALAEAKQKLADTQEEARKAGVKIPE